MPGMSKMTSNIEPTTNQPLTRKHHVCFNDKVITFEIPHRSSFTEEQIYSLWYQRSDYERIDDENDSILDTMMIDETYFCNKSNLYCTHGLEYLLPERTNIRVEAQQALWDAVIDEQLYQWRTGIENPEAIAKAYRETSIQHDERMTHLKGIMEERASNGSPQTEPSSSN